MIWSKNSTINELTNFSYDILCDSVYSDIMDFEELDLLEYDYFEGYEKVYRNSNWFNRLSDYEKYSFRQYLVSFIYERYETMLECESETYANLESEDFDKIAYELLTNSEYKKEVFKIKKYFELVKLIERKGL